MRALRDCEVVFDCSLKPVLNWANICSRKQLGVFGEYSWFLIGRTFASRIIIVRSIRRTATKLYSGSKKLRLNMFWEYSPYSTNIASEWLRAERSPADEEERKVTMSVDTSLASERTDTFADLWEAQPCLWDPE